ncbi:hypothetical protein ACFVZM_34515 [Streptomyces sioyaensis]|uniref:hypothetical protein n=1 Tax=Streptomyces sioyaensis TaxID=67364 RepID=UPI00367ECFD8
MGTYPLSYITRELALENVPAQYLPQGCNGMLGALLDSAKSVGHVGRADVFISLEQLVHIGELAAGDNVLLVSRRTGWICTASVVTILDLPPWSV